MICRNEPRISKISHGIHTGTESSDSTESIGAAFGGAPQGRRATLWMLSLWNLMILRLGVDPVQNLAYLGFVGVNHADESISSLCGCPTGIL